MDQNTYNEKVQELIEATKNNPALAEGCQSSSLGDAFRGAAGEIGESGEPGAVGGA